MRYYDFLDNASSLNSMINAALKAQELVKADSEIQALKDEIKTLKTQKAVAETEVQALKGAIKTKNDTIARVEEIARVRNTEIKHLKAQVIKLTMENNRLKKLDERDNPEPEPQPDRSAGDEATLNRFKELMGDVRGLSVEDITKRFLMACTTLAIEEGLKN